MNEAILRRRMYGGDGTPVIEVLHPDAIYFKTNEYAAPDSPYIWQWGIRISEMTKVIVDGAEVNPGDAFTELYNGANLQPVLSGVHEYYVYYNASNKTIRLHGYSVMSIIRFGRGFAGINKIERGATNRPIDIMLVDDNIPNISSIQLRNTDKLYVPVGCKDGISIASGGDIIEVEYKFIED